MKKKGITLIELVVSIAILAIALITITSVFLGSSKMWKKQDSKKNSDEYATNAVEFFRTNVDFGIAMESLYDSHISGNIYFNGDSDFQSVLNTIINSDTPAIPYTDPNSKYLMSLDISKDSESADHSDQFIFDSTGPAVHLTNFTNKFEVYKIAVTVKNLRNNEKLPSTFISEYVFEKP